MNRDFPDEPRTVGDQERGAQAEKRHNVETMKKVKRVKFTYFPSRLRKDILEGPGRECTHRSK